MKQVVRWYDDRLRKLWNEIPFFPFPSPAPSLPLFLSKCLQQIKCRHKAPAQAHISVPCRSENDSSFFVSKIGVHKSMPEEKEETPTESKWVGCVCVCVPCLAIDLMSASSSSTVPLPSFSNENFAILPVRAHKHIHHTVSIRTATATGTDHAYWTYPSGMCMHAWSLCTLTRWQMNAEWVPNCEFCAKYGYRRFDDIHIHTHAERKRPASFHIYLCPYVHIALCSSVQ